MGSLQAQEMSAMVDLDTALHWHLRANHYPPVHERFVPVAKQAIQLVRDGEGDTVLVYPNGLERNALHTVEGLHLWVFVDADEPDELVEEAYG